MVRGDGASCGMELAMGVLRGDASNGALAKEPKRHGSFLIK